MADAAAFTYALYGAGSVVSNASLAQMINFTAPTAAAAAAAATTAAAAAPLAAAFGGPPPPPPPPPPPITTATPPLAEGFKFYGMGTFNLAWSVGEGPSGPDAYGHVGDTYGYQSQATYVPSAGFALTEGAAGG